MMFRGPNKFYFVIVISILALGRQARITNLSNISAEQTTSTAEKSTGTGGNADATSPTNLRGDSNINTNIDNNITTEDSTESQHKIPNTLHSTLNSDGRMITSKNATLATTTVHNSSSHIVLNSTEMANGTIVNNTIQQNSSSPIVLNNIDMTNNTNANNIPTHNFQRYEGVVIATKVLWPKDLNKLKQWICHINHAYNDKTKYDVIVFTTLPWPQSAIDDFAQAALPSKLRVVLEAPPLEEQLSNMTNDEVKFLRERCGTKNDNETLTYNHHCKDPESRHVTSLGYAWQAEFRAYHIWKHPALARYKYMMWLDVDALISTDWNVDPMKAMVENNLTIMYAGFPCGKSGSATLKDKLIAAYGTSICAVKNMIRSKHNESNSMQQQIYADLCMEGNGQLQQIAGNHHITNLDVFRKDVHQQFLKNFTGDYRFYRSADDQMAVTIVSLMEQYLVNNYTAGEIPKKSVMWHEKSHGMSLKVCHHGMYDGWGKDRCRRDRFRIFEEAQANWTGMQERCSSMVIK